jgi:hypothetical protein
MHIDHAERRAGVYLIAMQDYSAFYVNDLQKFFLGVVRTR